MDTPKSKKVVLTIEDQPAIADLLGFLLDASELEVKRSDNGAEGLAMIQDLKPDLVIMDVMMPTMDGWQVYDTVRQNEATQHIPIIMLSVARQEPERRVAFRGSHVDFYMTKPFDVNSLRRLVQEILGLEIWIKSVPSAEPTSSAPPPPTPSTPTVPPNEPNPPVSDASTTHSTSPTTPSPTTPTIPVPPTPSETPLLSTSTTSPTSPVTPTPSVPPTTPIEPTASPPEPSAPPQVKE